MFEEFLTKKVPLSRQEMIVLGLLLENKGLLSSDLIKSGVSNVGSLKARINRKFERAGINKRVICSMQSARNMPYLFELIEE